jgi:hypothetical protein
MFLLTIGHQLWHQVVQICPLAVPLLRGGIMYLIRTANDLSMSVCHDVLQWVESKDTDRGSRPFHAAWTLTKSPGAHCINEGTVMLAGGIVNVVADALVTIIPIPLILRLKMPKHDQVGVLVLLSLGFFVTIAGIVRTYYIWLALVHSKDSSWYSHPLFIAAAVEVDVGIVSSANLPFW